MVCTIVHSYIIMVVTIFTASTTEFIKCMQYNCIMYNNCINCIPSNSKTN